MFNDSIKGRKKKSTHFRKYRKAKTKMKKNKTKKKINKKYKGGGYRELPHKRFCRFQNTPYHRERTEAQCEALKSEGFPCRWVQKGSTFGPIRWRCAKDKSKISKRS